MVNFPKVNNQYIVWQELSNQTGKTNLFLKNLVTDGESINIFNGELLFFDIGDDYIAWDSKQTINVYSIKDKKIQKLEQSGILPYMRNNELVYQATSGKSNVKSTLHYLKLKSN